MLLSLRQHPRKGKEFVFAPLRPRTRLNLLRLSAETCVAAPNFPHKLQLMGSDSCAPSVCWNGGGYAVMEGGSSCVGWQKKSQESVNPMYRGHMTR